MLYIVASKLSGRHEPRLFRCGGRRRTQLDGAAVCRVRAALRLCRPAPGLRPCSGLLPGPCWIVWTSGLCNPNLFSAHCCLYSTCVYVIKFELSIPVFRHRRFLIFGTYDHVAAFSDFKIRIRYYIDRDFGQDSKAASKVSLRTSLFLNWLRNF
jgi:hypothetical protein